MQIEKNLKSESIRDIIHNLKDFIETNLCSTVPNAFWARKEHRVSIPYIEGFDERQIPTKARSDEL